jgi:hypothetical protein
MTFVLTQIGHYYWKIGLCFACVAGVLLIRERERLPDRLWKFAMLIVLWPLAIMVLLLVLLFVPDILDRAL